MLTSMILDNFKCFRHQAIELRPLTLLTGLNAMGKSSVVQMLLLLRQSILEGMLPAKGLVLNGPLIRLGRAEDVLNREADRDEIGITLCWNDERAVWSFGYSSQYDDVLRPIREPEHIPTLSILNGEAHYLSAERIGPRALYDTSQYEVLQRHEMGPDGRFGVAYLDAVSTRRVTDSLWHKSANEPGVRGQLIAWLREITPGTIVRTRPYSELDRVTLGIGFETEGVSTVFFSPPNVGFGLSYVLPVIVAILAAPVGATVMIENPEAHLHPRGQSAMGRLMALGAGAGLQLIVETHSDHVLNGIRLAVKDRTIEPGNVCVHFFNRRIAEGRAEHFVESPRITADGRFDKWPEGFFDEWEKSLDQLLSE